MACLDPHAATFQPSMRWTIRNKANVQIYQICKFHTARNGNFCAYDDNCRFIHYEECHRPNTADNTHRSWQQQLVNTLGQTNLVLGAILTALTSQCFLNQNAPHPNKEFKMDDAKRDSDVERDDVDIDVTKSDADSKADLDDDAITVADEAVNADVDDVTPEMDDVKYEPEIFDDDSKFDGVNPVDAKRCDEQLSGHQIDLFKYLWANSKIHLLKVLPPKALPVSYPENHLCVHSFSGLPYENATLSHLKADKFNGLPVRITEFDVKRNRYGVELLVLSGDQIQPFYVKPKNVDILEPTGIGDAYKDFELHLKKTNQELLHKLQTEPLDDRLLASFLSFQLAPMPNLKIQIEESQGWSDMCYYVMTGCDSYKLAIDEKGCPQIIALLYHVCFLKDFFFIWKKYIIPINWIWTRWDRFFAAMTYSLSPPH